MKTKAVKSGDLPIGTVVAYCGDLSDSKRLRAIEEAGWLLCDGHEYNIAAYEKLFASIKCAHGGDGGHAFNVPNLKGRFLRGAGGGTQSADPDAYLRTAAAPGGNSGEAVGSLQRQGTKLPNNEVTVKESGRHTHLGGNVNEHGHRAYRSAGSAMGLKECSVTTTEQAGAHFHTLEGYATHTRPIHMQLYYIIKAEEKDGDEGGVPAGSVINYAGVANDNFTILKECDGSRYQRKELPDLYSAIGNAYGGADNEFHVPDLRGRFLRGLDHGTGRDKDADMRRAQRKGGNTGNLVGTEEGCSTSLSGSLTLSHSGEHSHTVLYLPTGSHSNAGAIGQSKAREYSSTRETSSEEREHVHTKLGGGDRETRPENISVALYVTGENQSTPSLPVGSIIPYGGSLATDRTKFDLYSQGWFRCDGSSKMVEEYPELFKVIGHQFDAGGTKTESNKNDSFHLPDLNGLFIMGVVDGESVGKGDFNNSTTGAPVEPIKTEQSADHTHKFWYHPTDHKNVSICSGHTNSSWNDGEGTTTSGGLHTHEIVGGDRETRPLNVAVEYLIKYK